MVPKNPVEMLMFPNGSVVGTGISNKYSSHHSLEINYEPKALQYMLSVYHRTDIGYVFVVISYKDSVEES